MRGIKPNSSAEVNDQFSPRYFVTAEDNLQPLSEQQKENKGSRQGRFLKPWRLLYITKRQASKPSICKIVNQILLLKSMTNFRHAIFQ
jgi:hypothetical protein